MNETLLLIAQGGKIFIGVSDSGEIMGIELKQESLQNWINQIKVNTQPFIIVDIVSYNIENKTDNYQAQTRNQLIAEAFYLTNDTEKYGSGYIRVREEMGNGYLVTLSYEEQKTTQETIKEKIIKLLRGNPRYTKQDLMQILDKGDSTIKEHLANLKKENIIRRVGSTKSGYWEVIDE